MAPAESPAMRELLAFWTGRYGHFPGCSGADLGPGAEARVRFGAVAAVGNESPTYQQSP